MSICLKFKRDGKIVARRNVKLDSNRRHTQLRLGKVLLNSLEVIGPEYSSIDVSLEKEGNGKPKLPKRQAD